MVLVVKKLRTNSWRLELSRERLVLTVALLVICVCIVVKPQALFLVGSLMLATAALSACAAAISRAMDAEQTRPWRILAAIEAVLLDMFGMSFLVIPKGTAFAYATSAGIVLIIDGVARIVLCLRSALSRTR